MKHVPGPVRVRSRNSRSGRIESLGWRMGGTCSRAERPTGELETVNVLKRT